MQPTMQPKIFHFLLNVFLFLGTGIVLHRTEANRDIFDGCPLLWESMLAILVVRCVRMPLRAVAIRWDTYGRFLRSAEVVIFTIFFVMECVTASRALNSTECVDGFNGPPLLAYCDVLLGIWDGCYVLSFALHSVLFRTKK